MIALPERLENLKTPGAVNVLVLGQAGSGKSTLISLVTNSIFKKKAEEHLGILSCDVTIQEALGSRKMPVNFIKGRAFTGEKCSAKHQIFKCGDFPVHKVGIIIPVFYAAGRMEKTFKRFLTEVMDRLKYSHHPEGFLFIFMTSGSAEPEDMVQYVKEFLQSYNVPFESCICKFTGKSVKAWCIVPGPAMNLRVTSSYFEIIDSILPYSLFEKNRRTGLEGINAQTLALCLSS